MPMNEMEQDQLDHQEEETRQEEARNQREEERQEQAEERTEASQAEAATGETVEPASEESPGAEESPSRSGRRQERAGEGIEYLHELEELERQLEPSEAYFKRIKRTVWKDADEEKQQNAQMDLLRERDKVSNLAYKISQYRQKAKGQQREVEIQQFTQDLLGRCDAVEGQFESCMNAVKGSVADRKTEDLIKEVARMRGERTAIRGTPGLAEYQKLASWLNYVELRVNQLDEPVSDRGTKRQEFLRNRIAHERTRLQSLYNKLPKEAQQEVQKKQEKSKILAQALNNRYNAASPIVRLIWKAKEVNGQRKEAANETWKDKFKKFKDKFEKVAEDVESIADPIVEDVTQGESEGLGDWLKSHALEVVKWLAGKLVSGGDKIVEKASNMFDQLSEMFEPLVSAGQFVMKAGNFIKKSKDMSGEEIRRNMETIMGKGVNFVVEQVLKLVSLFKPVPFLGNIAGLFSAVITTIQQVLQMIDRSSHKKRVDQEKELAKGQMLGKKEKYAQDEGLRDLKLFGFAESRTETRGVFRKREVVAPHLNKKRGEDAALGTVTYQEQAAALEEELGASGNIYDILQDMKMRKKAGQLNEEERKKYYKMKTLARIREHKEMKEDKYVNEKRIRQNWIDIAHAGVEAVANISGLIPAYGEAVSKGLSFANTVSKVGHKYGSKLRQRIRDWVGSEKSTANKTKQRSAMAQNIYGQMMYVSQYMRPENSTNPREPLFTLGEQNASSVSRQMNYLDMLTTTMSYPFSKMLGADNEDDLLDMMSKAFSRQGA